MKKVQRAFGYVRVSVDEDGGNNASIAAQGAAIRAHAEREGIEIVEVFEDLNVSGRSRSRKQFDRMMALATSPERPVDVIIVYALSRFARRLLTQVTSEHKLAEAQVGLVSLTEGFPDDPSGRMMRSIVAVINEKYALDASTFTRRDRRGNAARGFFNGGPVPFGYEAHTALVEGKKEPRKLFVQEEEAAVVRLIFDLALRGLAGQPMGTRAIAEHLNAAGHRLREHTFMHSSVDGILKREHYAGFYLDRTGDSRGVDEAAVERFGRLLSSQLRDGAPAQLRAAVRVGGARDPRRHRRARNAGRTRGGDRSDRSGPCANGAQL
ncbi:recombinase family protein [Sphingomonas sp. Mn802worker]|uniref:recombinase family protein n=1 Tax=Sphingomonas sp. Mn802worker TaxID=629773 RepID=UPI00037D6137|nr:recombinase family protein [Sphingomonas sp. Mn802worker]